MEQISHFSSVLANLYHASGRATAESACQRGDGGTDWNIGASFGPK
jgi:hypothetical protein